MLKEGVEFCYKLEFIWIIFRGVKGCYYGNKVLILCELL